MSEQLTCDELTCDELTCDELTCDELMCDELMCDECVQNLYLAGERVPPGVYKQVDSCHQVCLDTEDFLPAGMDGHATVYVRVQNTWAQIQQRHAA